MSDASYEYRPTRSRLNKLEEMHSFLKRCNVETSFSSVVDYCIDATYEGDYEWDAAMFEKSFKGYLSKRRGPDGTDRGK